MQTGFPMRHESAILVQWSFHELLADGRGGGLSRLIDHIGGEVPEIGRAFQLSEPLERRKAAVALALAVKSLDDFEMLRPALLAAGARLRREGVQDICALRKALFAMLQKSHGKSWTPAVRTAWYDVLESVAAAMHTDEEPRAAA